MRVEWNSESYVQSTQQSPSTAEHAKHPKQLGQPTQCAPLVLLVISWSRPTVLTIVSSSLGNVVWPALAPECFLRFQLQDFDRLQAFWLLRMETDGWAG